MTARRKRKSSEYDLQKAVCQYLALAGVKGIIYFAVPNGLVSDPVSVARMKAIGLRPGVADLCIIKPGGRAYFLELKSPKGRPTDLQWEFAQDCTDAGCEWEFASNIDDALLTLRDWGLLNITQLPAKYKGFPPLAPRLRRAA